MMDRERQTAIGVIETYSWSIGIVSVDHALKGGDVTVVAAELNDMLGLCTRIRGTVAAVRAAVQTARMRHDELVPPGTGSGIFHVLPLPARELVPIVQPPGEYNPLIEQEVVRPYKEQLVVKDNRTSTSSCDALGFIETQGFTAVIEAVDAACKAARVEIVGREKLGGGFIAVVLRGDVAAVKAALEAARPRVEGLGKLIATHLIARPNPEVLQLLPTAAPL